MSIYNANKAWLMLADGTVYEGRSFGATGTAIGEVVFTTSMTGCQETLTDPSYFGQIAVQTFPLIGNYGTNDDDVESDNIFMKGYIVREWCDSPSNFRARERIDAFLKHHNTIGLFDIDTRSLTRRLREHGVMNGVITTEPITDTAAVLKSLKEYAITGAVDSVGCTAVKTYPAHASDSYKIALYDFGYKRNIRESLRAKGCDVTVVPPKTSLAQLKEYNFDGIMLSNGPGNPEENVEIVKNLKEIAASGIPVMGVCLGHQLFALAMGASVEKLKYGHRGGNQPVINLDNDRTYVTTQNHGYAVISDSVDPKTGKVSYINANDRTCEGIKYLNIPAFTVQFHPEASAGPVDTAYLFGDFLRMIDNKRKEDK